jgi:hypothetical protein
MAEGVVNEIKLVGCHYDLFDANKPVTGRRRMKGYGHGMQNGRGQYLYSLLFLPCWEIIPCRVSSRVTLAFAVGSSAGHARYRVLRERKKMMMMTWVIRIQRERKMKRMKGILLLGNGQQVQLHQPSRR